MDSLLVILALATFFATLIGGSFIVKFRKYLPFFFAFAAGSLIAVSFLDLLPESLEIAENIGWPTRYVFITIVLSFFFYSLLERFFLTHDMDDHDSHGHIMGPIGSGSLVLHSFFDGIAIGAAFQIDSSVGMVVALAVLSHDFTDGANTVIVMLKNKQPLRKAMLFLGLDALAPAIGIIGTNLIAIPESALVIILSIFVGEFIYIGASTLLPETRKHLSKGILVAMALGILIITILTSLVSV